MLSDEVGEDHADGVAHKAAPRAGHVTVFRHKQDVDGQQGDATYGRHDGAPVGFANEFVPEREVEVDAHKDFGHHDNGYCPQTRPVVGFDDVLENGQVSNHGEEGEECEHDEILHYRGLAFLAFASAAGGENKRLIGVAERLGNHGHNHGDLHAGAVDAELFVALLTRNQKSEAYFVGHLVENAHETQQEQRPGVFEHRLQHLEVHAETHVAQFGDETEGDGGGADEIDDEDVADLVGGIVPRHYAGVGSGKTWGDKEDEEVESDVAEDEK